MDIFTSLDVLIGLIVIYLVIGLSCTIINEWVDTILQTRAQQLRDAIAEILGSGSFLPNVVEKANQLCEEFYQHPNILGLTRKKDRPTYISAATFRETLLSLLNDADGRPFSKVLTFEDLEKNIANLPDGFIRKRLESLTDDAKRGVSAADDRIVAFQARIDQWFNEAMERTSDFYKRRVQLWTFVSGAVLCVLLNIDTISIARYLYANPETRQAYVKAASQITRQDSLNALKIKMLADTVKADSLMIKDLANQFSSTLTSNQVELTQGLVIPIGWDGAVLKDQLSIQKPWLYWLQKILGLLLTVAAVSAGAPFWFDTLKKVMNIRNALKETLGTDSEKK